MKIQIYGDSNIGCVRKNNEDSLLFDEALRLSIVCDGIGGREGGEVASQLAAEKMKDEITDWRVKHEDPISFLTAATQRINQLILQRGIQTPNLEGMGTTMECSLFHDKTLYLAHIGDSRTYLFFNNQLWQLTIDHNVKTLMAYGDIPTEMGKLVGGDALVKALGVGPEAEPDIYTVKLQHKQLFMSASDGLFDMVSDEEIAKIIEKNWADTDCIIKELIELACRNGGVDNISLVITRVI